ncbi:3D domain-containing protein [Clostridium sp. AM58-1XD]|uniref:3D domain-containing protein n=1 Tax=Clostridium sp. AM58-1XD TaxID=2292307 RepID=UPI001FA85FD5|nr:3D domain-containing protein [Clostridium sp. AM58-1XD]
MKVNVTKTLRQFLLILAAMCFFSFPAFAAEVEGSYGTTDNGIYGWAWHKGHFGEILTVKILLYYDDPSKPKKSLSLTADKYNKNVEEEIGDGWHYFDAAVDWKSLGGKPSKIKAYAVYNDDWIGIGATASGSSSSGSSKSSSGSSSSSEKSKSSSSDSAKSSGKAKSSESSKPAESAKAADTSSKKGKSLGTFSVTGYCTCPQCIIGQGLTYSGKKPTGNHTISADLNKFPLGTKLMIDGIIYTVEDTGGGMVGNKLDIYFDNHAAAAGFGRQNKEVFEVVE